MHAVLPGMRAKNAFLIAASLFFYAFGEPVYVLLMIASAAANYAAGLLISSGNATPARRKAVLAATVAVNLAALGVFKYAGFAVECVNAVLPFSLPVPQIRLPIGISFFTFQALSYVIDVYRGETPVQRSFPRLLLYVSLFPQLIAGPIVKYSDVAAQLENRTVTADGASAGARRFICGLSKKLLLANTAGAVADAAFAATSLTAPAAWIGAVAYCLQIYFDFSGYSDMALGLGRMFGFTFLENFNYPYTAVSVQDFWRRWHISLSSWFRDYLYIPLGGNRVYRAEAAALPEGAKKRALLRKNARRTAVNRMLVFLCTGIWHGANTTFLLWGIWHGLFLTAESVGVIPADKMAKNAYLQPLARIYTLAVVLFGFVLFRADSVAAALSYAGAMFTGGFSLASPVIAMLDPYTLFIFAAALILCAPVSRVLGRVRALECAAWPASLALFALCVINLAGATFNPFIYFRF